MRPLATNRAGDRRAFVAAAARWLALGGLGATLAALAAARSRAGASGCVNRGLCAGCAVFSRCELPGAQSARPRGKGASA